MVSISKDGILNLLQCMLFLKPGSQTVQNIFHDSFFLYLSSYYYYIIVIY
ncbi:hypothetical protein BHE74_00055229 [Ensete ventricosum]|nr:hypothetical protein BHE74_00055229 [Ensete ventricosum]